MNDEHAKLCSSPEWASFLQTEVLAPLVTDVDLGQEMLELGPGPGAATDWLRHRVLRLTALELNPDAAERLAARHAGTNVTVVVGDCAQADLPDAAFDSVGTFTMLHHLPTEQLQYATLREAFRLLRPGGVLVGSDSLASNDLHHFHAEDTYNPVDPARLLVYLQVLGYGRITVSVSSGLLFSAHKPQAPAGDDSTADGTPDRGSE
jgi:SAM-dependent methyltransferase